MTRPGQTSYSAEQRAEVLRLVDEYGAAETSRRTGIPAGTLRRWKSEVGEAARAAGVNPDRADGMAKLAEESFATAVRALADVRRQLESGKSTNAKNAALATGILIDQVAKLERLAAEMTERQAAISQEIARKIADLIRAFLIDLGIPVEPGSAIAALLRARILEQGSGDPPEVPDLEPARRELRAALGAPLEPGKPPRERLGLPAPRPHPDQRDDEEHEPHD